MFKLSELPIQGYVAAACSLLMFVANLFRDADISYWLVVAPFLIWVTAYSIGMYMLSKHTNKTPEQKLLDAVRARHKNQDF